MLLMFLYIKAIFLFKMLMCRLGIIFFYLHSNVIFAMNIFIFIAVHLSVLSNEKNIANDINIYCFNYDIHCPAITMGRAGDSFSPGT